MRMCTCGVCGVYMVYVVCVCMVFVCSVYIWCVCVCIVVGDQPKASCMPGKHSTTEYSLPCHFYNLSTPEVLEH